MDKEEEEEQKIAEQNQGQEEDSSSIRVNYVHSITSCISFEGRNHSISSERSLSRLFRI